MLHCQMYTVKEFPNRVLSLRGDPYSGIDVSLRVLAELGVFFYRDQEHSDAVIIQANVPQFPANVWYEQLILNEETWALDEWEENPRYVEKYGDNLCWLYFNQQTTVVEMTRNSIRKR